MLIPLFKPMLDPPLPFPAPWITVNKLMVENFEKLMFFQFYTLRSYCDISVNQIRAAAEISDPASLRDFYVRQYEMAQIMRRKLLNDGRLLADLSLRLKQELDTLAQTTLEDVWLKAA